jgi:hypothetical protein
MGERGKKRGLGNAKGIGCFALECVNAVRSCMIMRMSRRVFVCVIERHRQIDIQTKLTERNNFAA